MNFIYKLDMHITGTGGKTHRDILVALEKNEGWKRVVWCDDMKEDLMNLLMTVMIQIQLVMDIIIDR